MISNCSEKALIALLNQANVDNCYEIALSRANIEYQLKPYNVMKLQPDKVLEIYRLIYKKFYFDAQFSEIQTWAQNQLRIFVWVVVVFAFLEQKRIEELKDHHWKVLSTIFHEKTPLTLEFQTLCLLKTGKSRKWEQNETHMLVQIMNEKCEKNKWNQIAKTIFAKSNKLYFRTPKQCRQQWLNHLDPTKKKSEWTLIEDYHLIANIIKNGKKWSLVAKELGNQRTEHMVKNRFKSLLNLQAKRLFDIDKQEILIIKIKQRLQSNSTIKKYLRQQLQKSAKAAKEMQAIQRLVKQTCASNSKQSEGSITEERRSEQILREIFEIEQSNNWMGEQSRKEEKELNIQNVQQLKKEEQNWMLKQQPDIGDLQIQQFFNSEKEQFLDFNSIQFFY